MNGTDEVHAAWADYLARQVRPLRTNVTVQAELTRALVAEAPPLHLIGDRLAGLDAVAAAALVVLPTGETDALLDALGGAVAMAASVLRRPPEDAVTALEGFTVASCWNALLVGDRAHTLPGVEPTAPWLELLADTPAADDLEVERRSTLVVATVGSDRLLRALAAQPDPSVAQPTDVARRVARALLHGESVDSVATDWSAWLMQAPHWLSAGQLGWADFLWAARAVHGRVEGEPVESVRPWLRELVGA
jgi:hypothetical protein